MKAILKLSLVAFVFLIAYSADVFAAVDQSPSAFVLCKNKKDVRTIRILPAGDKQENCRITYSKGGVEEIVGNNQSASACKSILKNIQVNLENSNWACRSVQSALVTSSSEVSVQ